MTQAAEYENTPLEQIDDLQLGTLFNDGQAGKVPLIAEESVPACPVCHEESFDRFAAGFDYEMQTCRNLWTFVKCRSCSHIWLNPRPAIRELGAIYPPTYYAYDFEKRVNPIALKGKELLDAAKMRGVLRKLNRSPRSFVDIGCGDGRFLRDMSRRGVPKEKIYGLELSEEVVGKLRMQGFQAFCERVEDCTQIPSGSIDLATMFHVIEHVDDPGKVVRSIRDWLAPSGVIALETPNTDSIDARIFKKTFWGGYHIPRHWNLFNPRSITRLLNDAGLDVVSISFQTGHSFWMYSLHHVTRYQWPKSRTISSWFDPLRGLPFLVSFTGFDKLRAAFGFRTSAMLVVAKRA